MGNTDGISRNGVTSSVHTRGIKNTTKAVMNKQRLCVLTLERAAPVAYGYTAKMRHWTSNPEPELQSLSIQPGHTHTCKGAPNLPYKHRLR